MEKLAAKYYGLILAVILFIALITRLNRLAVPSNYIFDEVYHAITAKLIARNDVRAFEWWNDPIEPNTAVDWLHPPLAKYTQAASILFFGENSFGWRFSSVIFGVLVIYLVAELSKSLFKSKEIALLAAFLASLDGLLLVQSRIAMNDIHVTFAILLTLWSYQQFRTHRTDKSATQWLIATGVSAGLAMGSKWSGLFVLLTVWAIELSEAGWQAVIDIRSSAKAKRAKALLKQFWPIRVDRVKAFLALFILPLALYVLSYSFMFMQGKSLVCTGKVAVQGQCYCRMDSSWWVTLLSNLYPAGKSTFMSWEARGGCTRLISHFWELHHQIWGYQTTLTATHPYQSRPLQWFLDLRPVWMSVEYSDNKIANIYAFGNPALFWIGDVVILLLTGLFIMGGVSIGREVIKNWGKAQQLPQLRWSPLAITLFAYFFVWLPWQKSPRIMFFYHYTPAVPLLCMLLAYVMVRSLTHPPLKKYREALQRLYILLVIVIAVTFLIWYPNWTGIPVAMDWANRWYFAIPSWK